MRAGSARAPRSSPLRCQTVAALADDVEVARARAPHLVERAAERRARQRRRRPRAAVPVEQDVVGRARSRPRACRRRPTRRSGLAAHTPQSVAVVTRGCSANAAPSQCVMRPVLADHPHVLGPPSRTPTRTSRLPPGGELGPRRAVEVQGDRLEAACCRAGRRPRSTSSGAVPQTESSRAVRASVSSSTTCHAGGAARRAPPASGPGAGASRRRAAEEQRAPRGAKRLTAPLTSSGLSGFPPSVASIRAAVLGVPPSQLSPST